MTTRRSSASSARSSHWSTRPNGRQSAHGAALGVGGIFLRARDPEGAGRVVRDSLGIETFDDSGNGAPWMTEAGVTAFSAHAAGHGLLRPARAAGAWSTSASRTLTRCSPNCAPRARRCEEPQDYEGIRPLWLGDRPGRQPLRAMAAGGRRLGKSPPDRFCRSMTQGGAQRRPDGRPGARDTGRWAQLCC